MDDVGHGAVIDCFRWVGLQAASKSRAVAVAVAAGLAAAVAVPGCAGLAPVCSRLAQRKPAAGWRVCGLALVLSLALAPGRGAGCELLPLRPLAPGLWAVPAVPALGGDSDAGNRGHVVHGLLARDGARLWALGSGPTPTFGARLRCTAERQLGRAVSDLVVPLAQAELALGARGLAPRRLWAQHQVAASMARQCPVCVDRLRQRLGASAADLGEGDPVQLPQRLLHGGAGQKGRLGPFDWWSLPRSSDQVTTLWRHRASGVVFAPGLLWGDGPPDLRDTDVETLARTLAALPRLLPGATRWLGQAGPLLDRDGVAAQQAYVQALAAAARQAVHDGLAMPAAPPLAGADHPRHALNWQRAWRQAEDAWLAER